MTNKQTTRQGLEARKEASRVQERRLVRNKKGNNQVAKMLTIRKARKQTTKHHEASRWKVIKKASELQKCFDSSEQESEQSRFQKCRRVSKPVKKQVNRENLLA